MADGFHIAFSHCSPAARLLQLLADCLNLHIHSVYAIANVIESMTAIEVTHLIGSVGVHPINVRINHQKPATGSVCRLNGFRHRLSQQVGAMPSLGKLPVARELPKKV
ncbi:hypothetical protein ACWDTP_17265 [Mycobacterium sp. NPDC003449]